MSQKGRNFSSPSQQELQKIITDPEGAKLLVKHAKSIGSSLASSKLSTNQIRAIFGEVRRIEGEWKNPEKAGQASRNLILLKPKMAYRAKRERGKGVENLVSVLDPAIDLVGQSRDNFTRFVDFFEAILAYHKAAGGS